MESKYLIEIRRIINSLRTSDVSNKDIYKLQKLEVNLCKRIENTIHNNPGIGKSFLTTTLRELLKEHQYVELKIKSKLKELQQNGYESNDEVYANTFEVINNFEDLIQSLAKTDKNYFTNPNISMIPEIKTENNIFINPIISITPEFKTENNYLNNPITPIIPEIKTEKSVITNDVLTTNKKVIQIISYAAIAKYYKLYSNDDNLTYKQRAENLKKQIGIHKMFEKIKLDKTDIKIDTLERNIKKFIGDQTKWKVNQDFKDKIDDLIEFIESDSNSD